MFNSQTQSDTKPLAHITIPYTSGLSEHIRRVARKYGIRTTFKTQNTLRQHLTKTKPSNPVQDSKNCIYRIPCECNREYIGETKRPLNVRVEEHRKNVQKGQTTSSKLAEHSWEANHKFNFKDARILHHESHYYKRKIIEASIIKLTKDPISQNSVELRPLWYLIIRKHLKIKPNPISSSESVSGKVRSHHMTLRSRGPPAVPLDPPASSGRLT